MIRKILILVIFFIISCKPSEQDIDKHAYQNLMLLDHYSESWEDLSLEDFPVTGYKTTHIAVHCTASKEGIDLKAKWFLDFFKNDRGWSKPGYNFIIELDGTIVVTVPINYDGYTTWNELSYGVKGHNRFIINISYVGGVDKDLKPKDTRTPAQKRSLSYLINKLQCEIPQELIVQGHTDFPSVFKACPSFDVRIEFISDKILNTGELFDYSQQYPDSFITENTFNEN